MCLAIPALVTEVEGVKAKVDILGNVREADLTLVGETKVGEYILLHAGFAIQKIAPDDALETLRLCEELGESLHETAIP